MASLFRDLQVVEMASVLAGPSAGMFFAELGANVVKIENARTGGDVTRSWKLAGEPRGSGTSAYFSSVNWGKHHLFLDLTKEREKQEARELIEKADVLLSNFRPSTARKLGMDETSLRPLNPALVHVSLQGFAQDPERTAYDVVMQAETGFMSMNGTPKSGPIKMPVALIDLLAAHQMKEAVLLGLLKKERTGKGSFVEPTLEASGLSSLANQATNFLMNGHIPDRMGSLHPNIAPYGEIFRTKDEKEVVLAVGSDAQFKALCGSLNATFHEQEAYWDNPSRVKNRETLFRELEPLIGRFSRSFFLQECRDSGVPAGAILNLKEIMEGTSAQEMLLEEEQNGQLTQRISTLAFDPSPFL